MSYIYSLGVQTFQLNKYYIHIGIYWLIKQNTYKSFKSIPTPICARIRSRHVFEVTLLDKFIDVINSSTDHTHHYSEPRAIKLFKRDLAIRAFKTRNQYAHSDALLSHKYWYAKLNGRSGKPQFSSRTLIIVNKSFGVLR